MAHSAKQAGVQGTQSARGAAKQSRRPKVWVSGALGLLLLIVPIGCAGESFRSGPATSALIHTFSPGGDSGIEADIRVGILGQQPSQQQASTAELRAFLDGLTSQSRGRLSTDCLPRWPLLSALAEQGIAQRLGRGELSEAAAAAKRERLRQFGALLEAAR